MKTRKWSNEASQVALAPGYFSRGIRGLTPPGSIISTYYCLQSGSIQIVHGVTSGRIPITDSQLE